MHRDDSAVTLVFGKMGKVLSYMYTDFHVKYNTNNNNNNDNNNNNYYYYYLLQLGCYPVAVVILHVYK